MTQNILLWLEDRPEEISDEMTKMKDIDDVDDIIVRRTPMGIKNYLEENSKENDFKILGIIIDVMLSNVNSLESIGLGYVKTPGGFDAGIAFLKYFLWKNEDYRNYPICILSHIKNQRVVDLLETQKNEDGIENIKIVEKYGSNWEVELKEWCKNLILNLESKNE